MKAPAIILTVIGLAVVFGFMGWALTKMGGIDGITGGSQGLGIMIAVGVVGTGALAAVLMRLMFWSSKKGFDETVRFEKREDDPEA